MSVVGGFGFSNYDKTSRDGGAPAQRRQDGTLLTDTDEKEEFFTPMEKRQEEVAELARQVTRQSLTRQTTNGSQSQNILGRVLSRVSSHTEGVNPVEYEPGSDMDPYSDNFNIRKWTRNAVKGSDGTGRSSGLSFKNLSVFGYGSDAGEFGLHSLAHSYALSLRL
jgi:ATP-binding cassette subfamily G (WHITE) protein 2 (PDR)